MYREGGKSDGKKLDGIVTDKGYVCPVCGSPHLSDERQFNGMFKTSLGPVDPLDGFIKEIHGQDLSKKTFVPN